MSSDIFDKRQRAYRVLSQQAETLLHNEVTVAALMSTKMQCVSPKTKIAKLRGIMQKQHMHHILVCESERILGVISDRDLNRWQQSEGYAEKMMTTKPLVTYPEVLLTTAITQMLTHRISCLPVVDSDARIVGILTSTDILIGFQAVLRTTSEMMTTLVDVTDIAIGEDVRTPSKEDNHVPVNLPKVSGQ